MTRRQFSTLACGAAALLMTACTTAPQPNAGATPLKGQSQTMVVTGEYRPLPLDRVDRISLEKGKFVFHGSTTITVDPPASADTTKVDGHWVLVTEGKDAGTRTLTFTHNMALDDFTLELPASDAEFHYGVFASPASDGVMVFAWGSESKCYWGYVTLQHHLPS
jgi:hypothetical protein